MATVLPSDRRELVTFGTMHIEPWQTNQVAIGLSTLQLNDFKTLAAEASDALAAAEQARLGAKAATDAYYTAVAALRSKAADCVRTIQNKAKSTSNPAVYSLAQIPPPDPRSRDGQPPAQPTDVRAALNPDGSVTLTWKCANPHGVSRVIYTIRRRLAGESAFTLVDTVGEKSFTDALMRGTTQAAYVIIGKVGQLTGPSSEVFTVAFGVGGNGSSFIAGTSTGAARIDGMKMAA